MLKLIIFLAICSLSATEKLKETKTVCKKEKDCLDTTNYTKYVSCVRRAKRECNKNCEETQTCVSDDECKECDCDYCGVHQCQTVCAGCCEPRNCNNANCCHQTCHAQCKSNKCRTDCKKPCVDNIQTSNNNITTIIHLHNVINNTNVIEMPDININVSAPVQKCPTAPDCTTTAPHVSTTQTPIVTTPTTPNNCLQ